MSQTSRTPDHPVNELFVNRWSPRAYTGEAMPRDVLLTLLEAARWAPSAYNAQPWRFLYALRGTPQWDGFLGLLNPNNQDWAQRAGALVIIVAKNTHLPAGAAQPVPHPSHALDSGAAWVSLALQAHMLGWDAHGMVGFSKDKARQELAIPAEFDVQMAIAIGKRGDPAVLSEAQRAREAPNARQPLTALAAEGAFAQQLK
jgi:nitroreductase